MKLRIWKKICIFALATAFASPFAACVNESGSSSLPSVESSTATESGVSSSSDLESSETESSAEESSSSDGSSIEEDSSSSAPERVSVDCGEYSLVFTMDGEGGCFLSAVKGSPAEVAVPERVNGAVVTAIGRRGENGLIAPFLRNGTVTKITLPDTVESIAPRAFYGCTALTEIRLSENLESLGDYAFFGCCKLRSVTLPARVNCIPKYAFYRCVALEEIQADGVLQADEYAFGYCVKLPETFIQRIPAPHETTFYGYGATLYPDAAPTATVRDEARGYELYFELHEDFLYYIAVDSYGVADYAEIPAEVEGVPVCEVGSGLFEDYLHLQTLILPDTIERIGDRALAGCRELVNFTMPPKVNYIGELGFYACMKLSEIVLPEGLTEILEETFYLCESATRVVLPSTLRKIGRSAFWLCSGFTELVLPDGVTEIAPGAFESCLALQTVKLPDGLMELPPHAFYECTALTSVTLPSELSVIGSGAFCSCRALTAVTLPKTLTEIKSKAFADCKLLTDVIYAGSQDGWENVVLAADALPAAANLHFEE